jgi:hypothetical protein
MAEAYAGAAVNQIPPLQGPRLPSLNLYFADEWAVNGTLANPTLDYRYKTAAALQVPAMPVNNDSCLGDLNNPIQPLLHWDISCRIVINYRDHIQPIWDKLRTVDADGNALATDMQCKSCHSATNAMGMTQLPAGQLDLTSNTSDRDDKRVMSYSELFSGDTVKDIAGNPVPELDANNQPVFDADGNPVFETVGHVMNAGSARGSSRFFNCFNGAGLCGVSLPDNVARTQSHVGLLTKGELRLISEWLDNGAQYYNDVLEAAAAQ